MEHELKAKIGWLLAVIGLLAMSAGGADFTAGYTFTANDSVTATKLNNLVGAGSISTTFYTGKDATTAPSASDTLLLVDAGSGLFRRCSLQTLLLSNTNLITSQVENTTPAGADWLLTYSPGSAAYRKATLDSLVFSNTNLISNRTNWTAPNAVTTFLLAYDSGAWSKVNPSNLVSSLWSMAPAVTNLTFLSAPDKADAIPVWKASSGAYQQMSISNLLTGPSAITSLTATDSWPAFSYGTTNTGTVTPSVLTDYMKTNLWKFTKLGPYSISSTLTNVAHGLGDTPQSVRWVLLCTSTDVGYAAGDEIPVEQVMRDTGTIDTAAFTAGANNTNVFIIAANTTGLYIRNKSTAARESITAGKWNVYCYVRRFL